MVSEKVGFVTFTAVFMLLMIPVVTTASTSLPNVLGSTFQPSSFDIRQLLPNPELNIPPAVYIRGTSGEFTYTHQASTGSDSSNYVALTWTHTAGTTLEWYDGLDSELPDCQDFIYFTQEFEWDLNEVPDDAYMNISFSIETTGDFDMEYGSLMFEVYVWLIDSSGNWERIYSSVPPYPDGYATRIADLSYFEIYDAWRGMIEDSSGVQEDPTDTLTLAVGLSPTDEFHSFTSLSSTPWNFYNGMVSAKIRSIWLYSINDVDPRPDEVLSPIINETWGGQVQDIFPQVPEIFENATDVCKGIAINEDGFVYILVDSQTNYLMYINTGLSYQYQTLLKFDSELNLIWARNHNNRTTGLGVCVEDGFIYTAGTDHSGDDYDLLVTKWNDDGDIVWETTWDTGIDEQGGAIDVTEDGYVYVYATRNNWRSTSPPYTQDCVLLKLNTNGDVVWTKSLDSFSWAELIALTIVSDGILTYDIGVLTYRDLLGVARWTKRCESFSVGQSENLYTATGFISESARIIQFNKSDIEGEVIWSTNFSVSHSGGWSEQFDCISMSIAPDGSVIALLGNQRFSVDYYILKLSSDGAYQWHKIVGSKNSVPPYYRSGFISVGPNGNAYIAVNLYSSDVEILSYDIGVLIPSIPGFSIPIELALVSLAGIGVIVSIVVVKRRSRVDYYSEYKQRYDL